MQSLGIYIHVPFCKSKCGYCDFCSTLDRESVQKDRYVNAILKHIEESSELFTKYMVDTVYFGGGTPTILGKKFLILILKKLQKHFNIAKTAEITLEANPESSDLQLLKRLKKAGFNRISIGVQSSDDEELKMLGRIHTFEEAKKAVDNARSAGFINLSLDLMYGLPGQTSETFLASVNQIIKLTPEHISCYALKLEPKTPLYNVKPTLPSDDEQADMYEAMVNTLAQSGYEQYEISNFARKGMRSKHNQKYWDLSEYLGFGPSSHSFCGGRRFSYTKDIKAYIDGILNDGVVIDEFEEVGTANRLGEYLMLRLRTADGIDENQFVRKFGIDFTPFANRLSKHIENGYASYDGNSYRLTSKGFFVSNSIILDLLTAAEETVRVKNIFNSK
ncbi:MAG: radical SAM family heme chaperone HemW [Clostridiales bacterium]|nr:radical SAM family heme chaperone HemW [Clostridiales bacterium]